MLKRSNSAAGKRLRRAKSTSSTHGSNNPPTASRHEPLDDGQIRAQAVTAAMAAYGLAPGPTPSKENYNKHQPSTRPIVNKADGHQRRKSQRSRKPDGEGSHFVANSTSGNPRQQPSRRSLAVQPVDRFGRSRGNSLTTEVSPTSAAFSTTLAGKPISVPPSLAHRELDSGKPAEANAHPRRVRKSRSMFSSSSQPLNSSHSAMMDDTGILYRAGALHPEHSQFPTTFDVPFGNPRPAPRPQSKHSAVATQVPFSNPRAAPAPPRSSTDAPRLSFSEFSKSSMPQHVSHVNMYQVDDELSRARDEYLQNFHKNSQKMKRPSVMFPSFKKRHDRHDSVQMPAAQISPPLEPSKPAQHTVSIPDVPDLVPDLEDGKRPKSGDNSRPQSFFKERIKRAFGRSSGVKDLVLPVQQVEATRPHFGPEAEPSRNSSYTFQQPAPIPPIPLLTASRPAPKPPVMDLSEVKPANPFHLTPSRPAPRPPSSSHIAQEVRPPSPTQSEQSLQTEKSRVTSWTDSTVTGSMTSQTHKRLTIIPEDAQRSRASSRNRHSRNVSNSSQSSSIFKRFVGRSGRSEDVDVQQAQPQRDNIDVDMYFTGQDVPYSIPPCSLDNLPSQRRRRSSALTHAIGLHRGTVRAVTPESTRKASSGSVVRRAHGPTQSGVKRSNTRRDGIRHGSSRSSTKASDGKTSTTKPSKVSKPTTRKRNKLRKPSPGPVAPFATSARRDLAKEAERPNRSRVEAREDARSLFFPRSPQKRATMQNQPEEEAASPTDIIESYMHVKRSGAISPSLYSQTNDSADALARIVNSYAGDTGMAVITPSRQVGKFAIGSSSAKSRTSQDAASVETTLKTSSDWRNWLSKEVADLGTPPPGTFSLSTEFLHPSRIESKHVREPAQMDQSEEESVIRPATAPSSSTGNPSSLATYWNRPRAATTAQLSLQQQSVSQTPRTVSVARKENQRTSSGHAPRPPEKTESRPSSRMNDRFPIIETGRPPSRARTKTPQSSSSTVPKPTLRIDTGKQATVNVADSNKENIKSAKGPPAPPLPTTTLRRPQSALPMTSTADRAASSLANDTSNSSASTTSSHIPIPTATLPLRPRPVTAHGMKPPSTTSDGASRTQLRRPNSALTFRPRKTQSNSTLTSHANGSNTRLVESDATLASIMKGPYHQGSVTGTSSAASSLTHIIPYPPPIPAHLTYRNTPSPSPLKENATPSSADTAAVAGAETNYIRAGSSAQKAKSSTTSTATGSAAAKKVAFKREDSPGKKMADRFLDARRWRKELVISPEPGERSSAVGGVAAVDGDDSDGEVDDWQMKTAYGNRTGWGIIKSGPTTPVFL